MSSKDLAFDDYIVVGAMVVISAAVGLHYGITKKKASSPMEYFLAGRKMTLIPMAFSAFATMMAPQVFLGTPAESYNFGMQIGWWCIMQIPAAFILNSIFIPLYYKMGSVNINKFFEIRYNRKIKNVATLVIVIKSFFQGSNSVFGTAVALNRVTEIDTLLIIIFLIGICVLYTTLGGMKGVMWADVIQGIVIVLSFLSLIVVGVIHVGGVGEVWKRSYDSGRFDMFDFNTDLTAVQTFWTSTVGYFFYHLASASTLQIVLQRYLTAPTIEDAKRGNMLKTIMCLSILFLTQIIGIIVYAEYHSCDPVKSKTIRHINQLVPAFAMKVLNVYPMLPGLFFAGFLAASLSTLSSSFNSMSAILFEAFVQPLKPNMNAKQASRICKLLCLFVAVMNFSMTFVTKNFPNVLHAAMSLAAIGGPFMVLVLLGVILPQANVKAALVSFISGILVSLWVVAGGLLIKHPPKTKPLSIEGCFIGNATFTTILQTSFDFAAKNVTEMKTQVSNWAEYFPLHSVSYLWISTIGVLVSTVVFIIMSQIFEKENCPSAVVNVIPDAIQKFHLSLSKPWRKVLLCDVYDDENKDQLNLDLAENYLEQFLKPVSN